MDDVNNMDETVEPIGRPSGGLSRRDMIKASVIAGGLVWSAPALLTGKAAMAATTPCCPDGTPVRFKLPSATSTNCGEACFDNPPDSQPDWAFLTAIPCSTTIGNCLISGVNGFVKGVFKMGGSQANIVLVPGVTLIGAAAKTQDDCYFTVCPCFAGCQNDTGTCDADTCKNVCGKLANGNACNPAPTIPPNRVWVLPNTNLDANGNPVVPNGSNPGYTTIQVDTNGTSLNFVDLALCLAPAITGVCP